MGQGDHGPPTGKIGTVGTEMADSDLRDRDRGGCRHTIGEGRSSLDHSQSRISQIEGDHRSHHGRPKMSMVTHAKPTVRAFADSMTTVKRRVHGM